MPEFQQTRTDLLQCRSDTEKTRLDLFASRQRLLFLQKELAGLDRQKGDNNENYNQHRNELDRLIESEKNEQSRHEGKYKGLRGRLGELQKDFDLFIDPRRELASNFSNETPFLLFPLRLETRFKTVNEQPQLWVRVYPDECSIDSFEPLLSQKEVNNAARFWAEFYSAGRPADPANPDAKTLDRQKAAWALLVKAHGDGRAAYITRQLTPEAESVFPVRGDKTIILAVVSDNWNVAQQATVVDLFKNLWFADKNDKLVKQIKDDFDAANPTMNADAIIDLYEPVNFNDTLPADIKREEADLQIAVVVFKDLDKKAGKEHSWSQATRVNILPERLALIRFKGNDAMEPIFGRPISYPLFTSPDPSDTDAQFKPNDKGDLEFGDSIKWVADFDRAIEIGMGFRVNLAQDELDGFSKLMVLGVKLGADATEGKKELEELFDHHYFSKKGLRIVPQGTPTNNTASSDSGYSSADSPDQTFDLYFNQKPGFTEDDTLNKRKDGQWLAEWLGIDYTITKKILHSDGMDQIDARNMNTALWPATIGYVMESLMKGGFSDETIAQTRDFFNRFVSGRGTVPAIRIGNQPYGILPTSAFRRLTWVNVNNNRLFLAGNNSFQFLNGLYQMLLRIEAYWQANIVSSVSHILESTTSPYQTLLDVIGLHPNSVSFHRRYLESLIEMSNAMSLIKAGFKEHSEVVNNNNNFLHQTLGYQTDILPQIAALLALPLTYPVKNLIDDVPLSEAKQIRSYTADNRNYIKALVDEAKTSEDALRTGQGLTERPDAELYRLLKYALEQGYHGSGIGAAAAANAFPAEKLAAMKTEQPFVHQQWQGEVTESKYAFLYNTVPAISPTKTVSEVIRDSLLEAVIPSYSQYLSSQLEALDELKDASTARLERAFVEHVDCCTYRLDAWKNGILTTELSFMRNNQGGVSDGQLRTGIFLGAFGWLENVRPERNKQLSVKQIPQDLVTDFNPDSSKVFLTDPANEGYIHAPSLNQAVTAAVLRNGYISHGKPDANNVLAVNLSSERIRLALTIIEGIQGGQSLAALLGYHFERELHDRNDLKAKQIDSYIYPLRKKFPLAADQLKDTKSSDTTDPSVDPDTVPITALEAFNVIHGTHLIDHVKTQTIPANKTYPFGLTGLTNDDADIATAITEAVNHITDIGDAIADMGMAESVHHIVMGNYDRAAGVLETYSKGNYPQEPDVIRTPRSGATLTHRAGIPMQYVALAAGTGPRAQSEPSMNQWLSAILPPMNKIICKCSYTSRADGSAKNTEISMQDIGLKPIDLIYILNTFDIRALNEIDDRFIYRLNTAADPKIDADLKFNYTEDSADASKFSLFQVMPLIRSLRALLVESASLTPGDVALPNEANKKDIPSPELPAQRVQDLVTALKTLLTNAELPAGIIGYLRALPPQDVATEPQLDDMRSKVDITVNRFAELSLKLGMFGIPQTGIGSLYTQKQQWFIALKNKIAGVRDRWQKNSDDYDVLAADPMPPVEKLQAMERLISSTPTPVDTITSGIVNTKKGLFDTAFTNLKNAVNFRQDTLIKLIQDIQALSLTPFDLVAFEIESILKQIPIFIYDLQARTQALTDDIGKKRIPGAEAILASLTTLSPEDQVKQVETAAKMILGDQFKMIPRYSLPAAQQAEISNSWNATNDLLGFSMTTRTNPLEDWLHGIARVHEKMKHLENCILLRQAFSMNENDLTMHPVQLPFKSAEYHWLALPFPETINLEESNTLLYTAFVANGVSSPNEICGLLVDEWTELIPAKEETTGITFHFDRPNCESPQTLLLVTPTQLSGNWQWNDLVDALIYTMDSAKLRGIEPDNIDKTPFASFLPAILGAESLFPYSIVLDNKAHYLAIDAVRNFST
jgi:hypothetical protein